MTTGNEPGKYAVNSFLTAEQMERLARLVPKIELKDRQGPGNSKFYYIDKDYLAETLDMIFGPDAWSFTVRELVKQYHDSVTMTKYVDGKPQQVSGAAATVTCIGTLKVHLWKDGVERVVVREGCGGATNAVADPDKGTTYGDMLENVFKSAQTDAMKRAAASLGYALGRNIDKTGQTKVSNLDQGPADSAVEGQGHGRTTVARNATQQTRQEPAKPAQRQEQAKPQPANAAAAPKADAGKPAPEQPKAEQAKPDAGPGTGTSAAKAPEADEGDPWEGDINGNGGSALGPKQVQDVMAMPRPPSLAEEDDFSKIQTGEQWTNFFRNLNTDFINQNEKPIEEAIYRLARAKPNVTTPQTTKWYNTVVVRLIKRVGALPVSNYNVWLKDMLEQLALPKELEQAG